MFRARQNGSLDLQPDRLAIFTTTISTSRGCDPGRKQRQKTDSLVPPDVIFVQGNVARFCAQCHEKRDLLDGDESHEKFFAGEVEPIRPAPAATK